MAQSTHRLSVGALCPALGMEMAQVSMPNTALFPTPRALHAMATGLQTGPAWANVLPVWPH